MKHFFLKWELAKVIIRKKSIEFLNETIFLKNIIENVLTFETIFILIENLLYNIIIYER